MNVIDTLENKIRAKPVHSACVAFGAGFILSRLPLLKIFALLLRIAVSLLRPALFVFGIAKTIQHLRSRKQEAVQPVAGESF